MSLLTISIYILGVLAMAGALALVVSEHPMRCAVSLLSVMLALAFIYALLSAPFMAVLQLIIYAGAIMTLIVFIVTLVDVRGEDLTQMFSKVAWLVLPVLACMFLLAMILMQMMPPTGAPIISEFGSVKAISQELLSRYLLHFEVASLLLFVGIIGVCVLRGKKESE